MNTTLVKQELIDLLCTKRASFILLMVNQVELVKQTHILCREMDGMIPSHPNAAFDYLDVVFYKFKSLMGENVKNIMPKNVNILGMSTQEITVLFTKVLDETLWSIVFNRLNIYSLMSSRSRTAFKEQLKENPLAFTPENISNTLSDLLNRQEELILDSLIESIQDNSQSYVCNDKFKFNKKVIFKDTTYKYGSHFKLRDYGGFKDVMTFLSKVIFGQKTILSVNAAIKETYLWDLLSEYFTVENLDDIDSDIIEFEGGKVTFFKNGNAHLVLSQALVSFLNQQLSKSNALKGPV